MRLTDCYALLELAPNATMDEIKASYRKLAFKYHPDLNPGDTKAAERFTRINEAYVQLKKQREAAPSQSRRTYDAETIRQEEEARVTKNKRRTASPFYSRQEEVLKDILNDPFAKQVFEDIFRKLKNGTELKGDRPTTTSSKNLTVNWGERTRKLDLGKGLAARVTSWAARQLDDTQTIRMPARELLPGTTLRVKIRHRLSKEERTIDVTLPTDFVIGRPLRLKGLGRKLGPWRGDLYLRFLAV